MPVSPQDFELYSRMTGAPMPSDAMSRMQMAPEVYEFTKNFARKPNILEKTGNLVKNIGKYTLAGAGLLSSMDLQNQERQRQEQLRNEQAKTDAEMVAVPESPEQQVDTPAMAKIRLGMEAEAQKQANRLEIQDRMDRRAAGGVVKTDLNPQQPTTADVYGQDYVPNQTASNIIDQKMVQGSQIEDKTPNVAEVLSESQDSMPISMFRPTQIPTTGALYAATPIVAEGLSKSGNEVNVIKGVEEEVVGSGATSDKVKNFLKKMGGTDEGSKLDVALLAAMQDRDKKERFYLGENSGDPALGNSPLLDHPDIVGGEDDINLPGGMNTGATVNLNPKQRELKETIRKNLATLPANIQEEVIEKMISSGGKEMNPLEERAIANQEAIDSGFMSLDDAGRKKESIRLGSTGGIPNKTDMAEIRKDPEFIAAQKSMKPKSTAEQTDDFMAKFVEGARSDIVRGQRGNQSLGITRIPATNGDSQVGFVLANRPIDQSPTTAITYGFGVAPGAEDIIKGSLDASTFDTYMDRGMKEARQGQKRKAGEIFEFLSPRKRIVRR